jgi:hypothetical protein
MSKSTKPKTKSPLKGKPLRNPGQSLDEELERLVDDNVVPYIYFSLFMVLFAGLAWAWRLLGSEPNPILWSIVAVIAVLYSTYRVLRIRERARQLKLGRDGEREVGQNLELLRESGCIVFHDVIGEGFNIDHVVLSQSGIFTIETKTFSKPAKGKAIINYDGKKVLLGGREIDRDILGQAAAQRRWLRHILGESTGKQFPVRAVIVFPGWYVESAGRAGQFEVWVLNPSALPKFIENEKQVLAKEDMMLAAHHLRLHILATT